jgi:hypothetical protein
MESSSLTPTNLLASASNYLAEAQYAQISAARLDGLETLGGRFFEDDYRVVMLIVFDTWSELHEDWTRAQASLVELISTHMTRAIEKSWDGYLALLTLDPCPPSMRDEIDKIRYDTFRVRKLVAAGDELGGLGEVERALLPLLPIETKVDSEEEISALDLLPDLLAQEGIEQHATELLLRAFQERTSLVEALHRLESGQ